MFALGNPAVSDAVTAEVPALPYSSVGFMPVSIVLADVTTACAAVLVRSLHAFRG